MNWLLNGHAVTEESIKNDITIYINIESGTLTVNSSFQNSEIEILNIEGQLIKRRTVDQNPTTIDISGFARGMYFVKVKSDRGVVVKKMIKE